jgi:hypothetical protein
LRAGWDVGAGAERLAVLAVEKDGAAAGGGAKLVLESAAGFEPGGVAEGNEIVAIAGASLGIANPLGFTCSGRV